jgi:hypothetical protein
MSERKVLEASVATKDNVDKALMALGFPQGIQVQSRISSLHS